MNCRYSQRRFKDDGRVAEKKGLISSLHEERTCKDAPKQPDISPSLARIPSLTIYPRRAAVISATIFPPDDASIFPFARKDVTIHSPVYLPQINPLENGNLEREFGLG